MESAPASDVVEMSQEDARRRATVVGISERLVAQAEDALRRQLARNPDSAALWRRLADTQRMLGRFAEAEDGYRRSLAVAPDPAATWVLSVLAPGELPAPPAGERAVPFVRLANFLTHQQQRSLWATALAGSYEPAKMGGKRLDSSRRSAAVAKGPTVRAVKPWFVAKLRVALPEVLRRLGADSRGLSAEKVDDYGFECNVTAHQTGDYYTCHTDTGAEETWPGGRRISYVYYFHRQPRRFAGGDLLLYDTDYDAGKTSMRTYTRLPAAHNALVLFPSNTYHEITRVVPAAGDTLAFADGRFTVNGWIHEKKARRPPGA